MNKYHRAKPGRRFLAVLFLLGYLLFLSFFLRFFSFNEDSASTDMPNSDSTVVKVGRINYIRHDVLLPEAHEFTLTNDSVIQPKLKTIYRQDSNMFGGCMIPFYVSLYRLIAALLCFGLLIAAIFACGFVRHMIIPHSIHAPPRYSYRRGLKFSC